MDFGVQSHLKTNLFIGGDSTKKENKEHVPRLLLTHGLTENGSFGIIFFTKHSKVVSMTSCNFKLV